MKRFFEKMADRLFALFGAIVLCQLPALISQYALLLSGHFSECKIQVAGLELIAQKTGKTLSEYIKKFAESGDRDTQSLGEWMNGLLARLSELSSAHNALSEASVWTKPFVFAVHVDMSLLKETTHQFTPSLPVSIEGLLYAFIGMFLGVGLFYLLKKLLLRIIPSRKHA